jgi:hypothetical protein
MKITEINCETGVETVRDMTEDELAAYEERKKSLEQAADDSQTM